MKKYIFIFLLASFFSSMSFADVKKKSKSKVTFDGFGTYTTEEAAKITESIKKTDYKNKFKGKGVAGKLVGKFVKQGNIGEITNLLEMKQYSLDHKKKRYTVKPIEKISFPSFTGDKKKPDEMEEKEYKSENRVKIIRSIFRIDETEDIKDINNFLCEKFILLMLTEWEDTRTGQRGIDSLSTTLWMTEFTDELKQANDEEKSFTKAHMKALGMDVDQMYDDILGTNWLSLLGKIKQEKKEAKPIDPKIVKEMEKFNNRYPVIIDGNYFAIRPKPETEKTDPKEDDVDVTDVKKSVGRFAKGLFSKKKEPEGLKPTFSYKTELVEYKLTKYKDKELGVGSYKLK